MAWRRPGDKPLSEPRMVSVLTHICVTRPQWVNHTKYVCVPHWSLRDLDAILILQFSISCYWLVSSYHLRIMPWMPRDLTDDKSTLVQVMALCRQATSHYLNQCWSSSMSPYGVTRPQWVKRFMSHCAVCDIMFQWDYCVIVIKYLSCINIFLLQNNEH